MKHSKKMTWAFFGAIAFVLCAIGTLLVTKGNADPATPTPGRVVGSAAATAAKKVPASGKATTTVPPMVKVGQGTWEVGVDVPAGKYKTKGAIEGPLMLCYWDVRMGSEDGKIGAQGVKNQANAQGLVTLKKGQFFTTSGCQDWTKR